MPKEDMKRTAPSARREGEPALGLTRKRSGPIPGGRAVSQVIQYKERRDGRAFTLRVHFDFDKTSTGDKVRLVNELGRILEKLLSGQCKKPAD